MGAGVVAAEAIGRNLLSRHEPVITADPFMVDGADPRRNSNADMGGQDFGMRDSGSWDDSSSLDMGSGDWDS